MSTEQAVGGSRPVRASGRWLAPALLALGVAIGGVGVWFMFHLRPHPGAYYEVLALDDHTAVALRHEDGSTRSFVELLDTRDGERWQALIPAYAGTPEMLGLAASPAAITVRVRRDGRDELWALSTEHAEKLGQTQLDAGPARAGAAAPKVVTVADHAMSFEFVGDAAHETSVTGIVIDRGQPLWRVDLGAVAVAGAWLDDRALWIHPAQGDDFGLARADGKRVPGPAPADPAVAIAARLAAHLSHTAVPADAIAPRPWHVAGDAWWTVTPDTLVVTDLGTGKALGVVGPGAPSAP